VNNNIDISALKATTAPDLGLNKPKNSGSGDLLSFLNYVAENLRSNTDNKTTDNSVKKIPKDIKTLSEKISAKIKNGKTLPKKLEKISLKDLTAKISKVLKDNKLLQLGTLKDLSLKDLTGKITQVLKDNNLLQSGALKDLSLEDISKEIALLLKENPNKEDIIKPSLLSDLSSKFASQLSNKDNNVKTTDKKENIVNKLAEILKKDIDIPMSQIAEKIDAIKADTPENKAIKDKIISKILNSFQSSEIDTGKLSTKVKTAQNVITADITSINIDKKTKTGNVPKPTSKTTIDITKLDISKADIKSVPDAGKTSLNIEKTTLKGIEDELSKLDSTTDNNEETLLSIKSEVVKSLKETGLDKDTIKKGLALVASSLKNTNGKKTLFTTAKKIIETQLELEGKTTKLTPEETSKHQVKTALQQHKITNDTNNLLTSTILQNGEAKNNSQINLSSKISGMNLNPEILSTLANSDGGSSNSNMQQGGQQQNLSDGVMILKSETTDGLNNKSFTNYLSSARSTPSGTTEMINLQLKHNISSKISSMTLQLTPNKLGSLDIKLKFKKDGSVKAHLIVEKPETLAMLQKDSGQLQKVLQHAGLNTDQSSLSFDLKQNNNQQSFNGFNQENNNHAENFATHMNGDAADEILKAQIAVEAMGYITETGVNIRV